MLFENSQKNRRRRTLVYTLYNSVLKHVKYKLKQKEHYSKRKIKFLNLFDDFQRY